MSIDERIERLLVLAEAHDRRIEDNNRRIEASDRKIEASDRKIEASDRKIAEIRETHQQQLDELREANRILVQIVSQQQDNFLEYKKTTNLALDRLEQTIRDIFGQHNNGSSN
ncbi:MAG: hypothetical protein AAGA60_13960 [Cyanobacteria bacterium P01_E01_bin.42]